MAADQEQSFKGRHFTSEVILWALRWYLAFPISYRDLSLMLADRGVAVDHTTLFRWVQSYAVTLEQRIRRHLRPCTGSWRVDETYIKVKGVWTYLYRAVDSLGQTIDFLLSAAHRQPADDHGGQEPGLSACHSRHEAEGRVVALLAAAAVQILEQYCGAGSPAD
jgi:hypothetical protein